MNGQTVLFGAVMWLTAGIVVAAIIGPLLRRGAEAAGPPVSPRQAKVSPASRRLGGAAAGGVFLVGLLAGGTGLAAAGSLPGPAQGVARDVLRQVGIDVPAVDEAGGPQQIVAAGIDDGEGSPSPGGNDTGTRGQSPQDSPGGAQADGAVRPDCAERPSTDAGEPANRPLCSDSGDGEELAGGPLLESPEGETRPPPTTEPPTPPVTVPGDPATTTTTTPVPTTEPPVTTTTPPTTTPTTSPPPISPPAGNAPRIRLSSDDTANPLAVPPLAVPTFAEPAVLLALLLGS